MFTRGIRTECQGAVLSVSLVKSILALAPGPLKNNSDSVKDLAKFLAISATC